MYLSKFNTCFQRSYRKGHVSRKWKRRYGGLPSPNARFKLSIGSGILAAWRFQTFEMLSRICPTNNKKVVGEGFLAANHDIHHLWLSNMPAVRAGIAELMNRGVQAQSPAKLPGGNDLIEIDD
jgi:hypothetical protein